jgi:hypothetical protein
MDLNSCVLCFKLCFKLCFLEREVQVTTYDFGFTDYSITN